MKLKNKLFQITFGLLCLLIFSNINFAQIKIPSPKLVFDGTEEYENGQISHTIYWLSVENRDDFPDETFEIASDLPPCGKNTNASRSWIEVRGSGNQRLNSFCGIKSPIELNKLSFSLQKGAKPPKFVYLLMVDRRTGKKYSSNLAEIKIPK